MAKEPAQGADPEVIDASAALQKKKLDIRKLLEQEFIYTRENRSDPFVPFISVKTVKIHAEEQEEVLSGMQLFEPGQLTVVAIIFFDNQPLAMLQDSMGVGHIVREKTRNKQTGAYEPTKIGRRGKIKKILPNVVVIEEWYHTTAGQKRYKNIEMVLIKEGGK